MSTGLILKTCCCGWKLTPCYETTECLDWSLLREDNPPSSWTLTFQGTAAEGDCKTCGGRSAQWNTAPPSADFNRTITVDSIAACSWRGTDSVAGTATFSGYSDNACANLHAAVTPDEFRASIDVTLGELFVQTTLRINPGTYLTFMLQARLDLTEWDGLPITLDADAEGVRQPTCNIFLGSSGQVLWFWGGVGGQVTLVPGDVSGGGRCPGGSPTIVSNNLSAYDGDVITLTEDAQEVCYTVTEATPEEVAAAKAASEFVTLSPTVIASLIECGTDCGDCCDDNCP